MSDTQVMDADKFLLNSKRGPRQMAIGHIHRLEAQIKWFDRRTEIAEGLDIDEITRSEMISSNRRYKKTIQWALALAHDEFARKGWTEANE